MQCVFGLHNDLRWQGLYNRNRKAVILPVFEVREENNQLSFIVMTYNRAEELHRGKWVIL